MGGASACAGGVGSDVLTRFARARLGRDFVMTFSSGVGVAVGVADEETSTIGVATGVETGSGGGGVGAGVAFIFGNGVGSIGISVGGPLPRRARRILRAQRWREDKAREQKCAEKNFHPNPAEEQYNPSEPEVFFGVTPASRVVCRLNELDERPRFHLVCPPE